MVSACCDQQAAKSGVCTMQANPCVALGQPEQSRDLTHAVPVKSSQRDQGRIARCQLPQRPDKVLAEHVIIDPRERISSLIVTLAAQPAQERFPTKTNPVTVPGEMHAGRQQPRTHRPIHKHHGGLLPPQLEERCGRDLLSIRRLRRQPQRLTKHRIAMSIEHSRERHRIVLQRSTPISLLIRHEVIHTEGCTHPPDLLHTPNAKSEPRLPADVGAPRPNPASTDRPTEPSRLAGTNPLHRPSQMPDRETYRGPTYLQCDQE